MMHYGQLELSEKAELLVVTGLTKTFGGLLAVNDVSFQVAKGEIIGLIGPNGSGKTTILEMVSGFQRPTQGQVFFKGVNLVGLKPNQICQRGIARSFQLVEFLHSFTVYDAVLVAALSRLSMRLARRRTEKILKTLDLSCRSDHLVKNLSAPGRKLLDVARVLALEPEVVLFDEIMAGLGLLQIEFITSLIRKLRQEKALTVLVVEHHMKTIRELCDRVLVLNHGTKIAEGRPEEVLKDKLVIHSYLGEKT